MWHGLTHSLTHAQTLSRHFEGYNALKKRFLTGGGASYAPLLSPRHHVNRRLLRELRGFK